MQKLEKKKVEKLFFSLFILFEVLPTKSLGAFQSRNPRFQNVAFLLGLSKLNDTSPCFANLPPSTSFHSRWTEFLLILAFSFIFFRYFHLFCCIQLKQAKSNRMNIILTGVFSFCILVYSCSSFGVFECVYALRLRTVAIVKSFNKIETRRKKSREEAKKRRKEAKKVEKKQKNIEEKRIEEKKKSQLNG